MILLQRANDVYFCVNANNAHKEMKERKKMIDNILAFNVGDLFTVIVLMFYAFIFALVIICLVRGSRYFMTAGKEQKLMRMELSRLAEEVHLIQQKLEGGKE